MCIEALLSHADGRDEVVDEQHLTARIGDDELLWIDMIAPDEREVAVLRRQLDLTDAAVEALTTHSERVRARVLEQGVEVVVVAVDVERDNEPDSIRSNAREMLIGTFDVHMTRTAQRTNDDAQASSAGDVPATFSRVRPSTSWSDRREVAVPEPAEIVDVSRSVIADFDVRFGVARGRLLRIAGSLVGAVEAEDVVQDTYVAARRRLPQLRDPDALEAWLTAIAVNLAFSRHRRVRKLRELLPRLHRSQVAHRSRDLSLRELVENLPPRERTLLVLHYGHGYRLEEIAGLLDLTHTNVRTIIVRTRRRLFTAWREADR